ncbi:hypothetical protein OQA88_9126, partial [Cercophora sp. LCS_1]
LLQYQSGDSVRIIGQSLVYKVIAITGCMITIVAANPQPDGQRVEFDSKRSVQTLDQAQVERVATRDKGIGIWQAYSLVLVRYLYALGW